MAVDGGARNEAGGVGGWLQAGAASKAAARASGIRDGRMILSGKVVAGPRSRAGIDIWRHCIERASSEPRQKNDISVRFAALPWVGQKPGNTGFEAVAPITNS